ncbi:MAG: ABC transporter permease, partial [Gemmatimonadales bacterium]
LRYGLRMMTRTPVASVVTTLVLAFGIGANTTMFGVIHAVLLRPLPYQEPERLVRIWEQHPQRGLDRERVGPQNLLDWRDQNRVFEQIAFWGAWRDAYDFTLVGPEGREHVRGAYVSANLFPVLGVGPLVGQAFQPEDDEWERNPVAVLGHGLWQRRFGGDPGVIGRTLSVDTYNRRDYTIVGVMAPSFAYPEQAELWLPAGWMGIDMGRRDAPWLMGLARLRSGTSLETARVELQMLQQRIAAESGTSDISPSVAMMSLTEEVTGPVRPALLMLQGAVLLVLLIACANVANLLLAQAAARQREIALRSALGAGRYRLLRQLLCESVVRALLGGGLGVLLAVWGMWLVRRFEPGGIPRVVDASLNVTVLTVTLVVSLIAAVLFGLAPALHLLSGKLSDHLREGAHGATAGVTPRRVRDLLLVTEVAMTVLLLVGAGLLLQSLHRLQQVELGFTPERLFTAQLDLSSSAYTSSWGPGRNRPQVFSQRLIARLTALPGVRNAAATDLLPPDAGSALRSIGIPGRAIQVRAEQPVALVRAVTPTYFDVMGIPLQRGRSFSDRDTEATPQVAIINETLARRYFPNTDPIGQRLADVAGPRSDPDAQPVYHIIVGVVGDVRNAGLHEDVRPEVYKPSFQWAWRDMALVIRTDGTPSSLRGALQREVLSLASDQPVSNARSMEDVLSELHAQPRFRTLLIVLFGAIALVLAAVGIYGVLDYGVTQRTREIAVRLALGASNRAVVWLVLGQGLLLVVIGMVLGLCGAALVSQLMSSLLFGVSPVDPLAFGGAAAFLVGVAWVAMYLPARRATKVDPIVALRAE